MGLAVSQRCGGTPREQTSESGGGEGKYPYTTGFNTSEIIQTSESGGVRLFVHRVPGTHVLLYNGSYVGGETVCSVRRACGARAAGSKISDAYVCEVNEWRFPCDADISATTSSAKSKKKHMGARDVHSPLTHSLNLK